jgi:hypothetical protein
MEGVTDRLSPENKFHLNVIFVSHASGNYYIIMLVAENLLILKIRSFVDMELLFFKF